MVVDSVGTRLRKTMTEQRINCVQLATAANVRTSFLYDILNGKSANPSAVQLAKVAHALNVSLSYLANTETPYTGHTKSKQQTSEFSAIAFVSLDTQSGRIISHIDYSPGFQMRIDWLEQTLGLSIDNAKFFRITSDDMSPKLIRGDVVLIDTSNTKPSPPGLFLIFDGVGLTVRNIAYIKNPKNKRISVRSENQSDYKDDRDLDDVLIVGRIVWLARCI
ncbi:MAG: XRE family transcriptional regulator [Alphaproteobacteria bacterium]